MDIYFNNSGGRASKRKAETADSPNACKSCGRNWSVSVIEKRTWEDAESVLFNVFCESCGNIGAQRRTTQQAIDAWNL